MGLGGIREHGLAQETRLGIKNQDIKHGKDSCDRFTRHHPEVRLSPVVRGVVSNRVNAVVPGDEQGPAVVKLLRNDNHAFLPKHFVHANDRIQGPKPREIEHHLILGHTTGTERKPHLNGLIVAAVFIVAAHDQSLHRTGANQVVGRLNPSQEVGIRLTPGAQMRGAQNKRARVRIEIAIIRIDPSAPGEMHQQVAPTKDQQSSECAVSNGEAGERERVFRPA